MSWRLILITPCLLKLLFCGLKTHTAEGKKINWRLRGEEEKKEENLKKVRQKRHTAERCSDSPKPAALRSYYAFGQRREGGGDSSS